jgi:hypothetical protein
MPSLAQYRTKYEVKRTYRFMLIFPSEFGGTNLQASVFSSKRPTWKVGEAELDHLNIKWWIAMKPDWEPWSCQFYDYLDDNTLVALMKWYKNVYDPKTTFANVPSVYKKDIMIEMLGPQYEPVETYTLYGAWPQNIDGGDLNMSSSEVAKLNVTFRFDYAILNKDY